MPKDLRLNQVIAIEKGTKQKVNSYTSTLFKELQKPELFNGQIREYTPKDDDGEVFPNENKKVQKFAEENLSNVRDLLAELWDLVLTKDLGNGDAKADIVVEEEVLATDVPATTLLYLEKQLDDLKQVIDKSPVLDPQYNWTESGTGLFFSDKQETNKTKTMKVPVVLHPGTEEHPPQCELVDDTVVVGKWSVTKQSSALSEVRKQTLQNRVNKLRNAVKQAREAANMTKVERKENFGARLIDWVLK